MKIISWNVNGLRANVKKGGFDWLLNQDVDIFCVQETKAHPDDLPKEILSPTGYFSYFDHSKLRKGYSGVAVWTKEKPEKVEYGLGIPELNQEGRFLELHFKSSSPRSDLKSEKRSDLDDFVLINCYFPNGGGGPDRLEYKLKFYDAFLNHIEKLKKSGKNVIFCGDVNTAHNEVDLARPKENEKNTGFLRIERDWLDKITKLGWIDTFRYLHPQKSGAYTWWDMKTFARDRNVGWRLDYLFISPSLLPKLKKSEILDNVYGSDHCPVELEMSE